MSHSRCSKKFLASPAITAEIAASSASTNASRVRASAFRRTHLIFKIGNGAPIMVVQPTSFTFADRTCDRWVGAGDRERNGLGVDGEPFEPQPGSFRQQRHGQILR